MKRRVIKKNINRFITPHIRELPRTNYRGQEIEVGDELVIVDNNHTIINGKRIAEGERYFRCDNLLLNIRRSGEAIKTIIDNHKHVYLRLSPEVRGNHIRTRIITEKVSS